MEDTEFGFTEIEHTADWALKVWAPDLSQLFAQAAVGMYWLMETTLRPEPRCERQIELAGGDAESLLVGFLSELLYLGETVSGAGIAHKVARLKPLAVVKQRITKTGDAA